MKICVWNQEKNRQLIKERGISFEQIACLIEDGGVLDLVDYHNVDQYSHHIDVNGYAYLVPLIEDEEKYFLITIIPSRKATKQYLKGGNDEKNNLTKEEKDLVSSFEKGEWTTVKSYDREVKKLRQSARDTMKKDERITVRLTKADLRGIRQRAANEGIPYQTLISSLIHKYVVGSLKV